VSITPFLTSRAGPGASTQRAHLQRGGSLALTPAVVAHRGASGHRPEHTLDAYRLAIAMGADDIELDLVPTRDGVLVARHESELSTSTDVAGHPEFAGHHTTKCIDGTEYTGWFTEDFTLAELRRLRAREPWPAIRPANAAYDGRQGIATFEEILAMVRAESARHQRSAGVMCELKHPSYFASIGLPLGPPLQAGLRRHGMDHPRSRVSVMSFEPVILRQLAGRLRVIQLLGPAERSPADLAAAGDSTTYGDLATPGGLAFIDQYADGIGAHKSLVLPRAGERPGGPTTLVRDAHRLWLTVHVWTLRAENRSLPACFWAGSDPNAPGDLAAEARLFLDAGVDGLITDHPGLLLGIQ
jgi:glycerophosphoryl diester phosphodiesterase